MKLFVLHSSQEFGHRVAPALQMALSQHEEIDFEGGGHKCRPLECVRHQDV